MSYPTLKAVRLPRSTTALAEARLERMEIRVVILTSVEVLISRGVTFMRSACSGIFLCPSTSSDVEARTTRLEKFHQAPSERLEYVILGIQL
ncbi:MAG: hypothetical protein ACFFCZ_20880 [Promethearchaeota archaeon]